MPTFKVQEYALYIRTYEIEANTASEAASQIDETTPAVAEEYIGQPGNEEMERNEFLMDARDPNWQRLFDEWPGGGVETIPALRPVENVETGERWDRWDGYWPPASVPGERVAGRRV